MIHLAISERTLYPYGATNVDVVKTVYPKSTWKMNQEFDIDRDYDIRKGEDYHELTYENRSIDLDTISAPPDHLVTGVRFKLSSLGHLKLEIRVTSFDYKTGELNRRERNSRWIEDRSREPKQKIWITDADIPTRSPKISIRERRPNRYVEFVPTDIYKDVAQTTGE